MFLYLFQAVRFLSFFFCLSFFFFYWVAIYIPVWSKWLGTNGKRVPTTRRGLYPDSDQCCVRPLSPLSPHTLPRVQIQIRRCSILGVTHLHSCVYFVLCVKRATRKAKLCPGKKCGTRSARPRALSAVSARHPGASYLRDPPCRGEIPTLPGCSPRPRGALW